MQKKYFLPRHTILAKQSSRFGAAVVDFALTFLFTLIFYYGCFYWVFTNYVTNEDFGKMASYEINSHLVIYDEEAKTTKIVESSDDYKVYEKCMVYFYMSYLTGENIEVPEGGDTSNPLKYAAPNYDRKVKIDENVYVSTKEFYSIEWYNKNILEIDDTKYSETGLIDEEVSAYFTYQLDSEGKIDKSKIGIPRENRYDTSNNKMVSITDTQLASFYKKKYTEAYYTLIDQPFYADVASHANFYTGISFIIPFVIGSIISYIVVPLCNKRGATIGKLIFKLGLANIDGYSYKKYQLFLRIIPLLLTSLSMILVKSSIYICVIIICVIGLTSFALMMGSPKKCSLHDFVARTIVIDYKASIIFDDPVVEEKYLLEEERREEKIIYGGEEPDIKYEKY